MTGRKENKQKGTKAGLIRKISALAIAILLVITGIQVDWKSLVPSANAAYQDIGFYIDNGIHIGGVYTAQGWEKITDLYIQASVDSPYAGAEVTAELKSLSKNVVDYPTGGTSVSSSGTGYATIANPAYAESIQVHLSTPVVLAPGETLGAVLEVTSSWTDIGGTIENPQIKLLVDGDSSGYPTGYYEIPSKPTFEFQQKIIEFGYSYPTQSEIDSASIDPVINVIGDGTGTYNLYLAPGQSFNFEVTGGEGIWYDSPQTNITVNQYTGAIVANAVGNDTVTIKGTGVKDTTVNVKVVTATVTGDTYNGTPISGTIICSDPTISGSLVVSNPQTNAGTYGIQVIGNQGAINSYDVRYYSYTTSYTIDAKDIASETFTDATTNLTIDPATSMVTAGTITTADGSTFNFGYDFTALAVETGRALIPAPAPGQPAKMQYTYNITIEGVNNLTGTNTSLTSYTVTQDTNITSINDLYEVRLSRTEVIRYGTEVFDDLPKPDLTFINKTTGAIEYSTPGDISVVYEGPVQLPGVATVKITSSVYGGEILLEYFIKQDISSPGAVTITLDKPSYVDTHPGTPYTPVPTVTLADGTLVPSDVYDVTYQNNTQATDSALVIITAKEGSLYKGSAKQAFAIYPSINSPTTRVSIGGAPINPEGYGVFENGFKTAYIAKYTGSVVTLPSENLIQITINNNVLPHNYYEIVPEGYGQIVQTRDMEGRLIDGESDPVYPVGDVEGKKYGTDVGLTSGSVLIKTIPEYGSQYLRIYFGISPGDIDTVSVDCGTAPEDIAAYIAARTYTGMPILLHEKPGFGTSFSFVVKDSAGNTLQPTDYTISYDNNVNAGNADLIVTGKEGGNFAGSVVRTTFPILPYDINGPNVTVDPIDVQTYSGNGTSVEPDLTIKFATPTLPQTLVKDGDFTVVFSNNTEITTANNKAEAEISGIGNFNGKRKVTFDIGAKNITNGSVTYKVNGILAGNGAGGRTELTSSYSVPYSGEAHYPKVTIFDNNIPLTEGTDFRCMTRNNINVPASEAASPVIFIYGMGNYKTTADDVVAIKFTITPKDVTNPSSNISIAANNGDNIEVFDGTKKLTESVDYTYEVIKPDGSLWDKTSELPAGKYDVKVTFQGNYTGIKTTSFDKGKNISEKTRYSTYLPLVQGTYDIPYDTIKKYYHFESLYIGKNYGVFITTGSGVDFEIIGSAAKGDITVDYAKVSGVDGFTAGDEVEVTINGTGVKYYGTQKIRYNIQPTHMEYPKNSSSPGDYDKYKDNYRIEINGQTAELTGDYYVVKYKYTGTGERTVTPVITNATLNPLANKYPVEYPDFPSSIPLGNLIVEGEIDMTQEVTGKSESHKLIVKPAPDNPNFVGERTVYYNVEKTPISDDPGSGFSVTGINASYPYDGQVYDGTRITPVVTYNGNTLVKDTDYTVTFTDLTHDNKTASDNTGETVKGGIVTITGAGVFSGSITREFRITQKTLTSGMVSPDKTEFTYDGNDQRPTVTVTDTIGGTSTTLVENRDYTKTKPAADASKVPGNYKITITPKGNYTGSPIDVNYKITANINTAGFSVENVANNNGYDMAPNGTVTGFSTENSGKNFDAIELGHTTLTLTKGTDYSVTLSPNMSAPSKNGTITIKGEGVYTGTKTITGISIYGTLAETNVSGIDPQYPYTGYDVKPTPVVTYNGAGVVAGSDTYTVTYSSDVKNIGEKTVTIKPGTLYNRNSTNPDIEKKYNILYYLNNAVVRPSQQQIKYDGTDTSTKVTPTVVVAGKTLGLDTDYSRTYSSDTTNVGTVTITIGEMPGKSYGSTSTEYQITPINNATVDIALSAYDVTYSGQEQKPPVSSVKVGSDSVNLSDCDITYSNNINVTTEAKVRVNIIGGNYKGSSGEAKFNIAPKHLSTITPAPTAEDIFYSGTPAIPPYTITDGGRPLAENVDFTVSTTNTAVGSATLTFTGAGNYTGTTTATYNIKKLDLNTATISFKDNETVYTGEAVDEAKIRDKLQVLVANGSGSEVRVDKSNYTIKYFKDGTEVTGSMVDTGEYTMTIIANTSASCEGEASGKFTVLRKTITDDEKYAFTPNPITRDDIDLTDYEASESGGATIKNISFTDNSWGNAGNGTQTLVLDQDYEVVYVNNTQAGTGATGPSVNIRGLGNYQGSLTRSFTLGKNISDVTMTLEYATTEYDGYIQIPQITSVKDGSEDLTEEDYTVIEPSGAVSVGTYTITINGKGKKYFGEKSETYEITQRSLTKLQSKVVLPDGVYKYDGKPAEPEIEVYDVERMVPIDPSEYTVTYTNNANVSTSSPATYTVTMKSGGNYTPGTTDNLRGDFWIVAQDTTEGSVEVKILPETYSYSEYNGTAQKPPVAVYYNGAVLPSSNYDVEYTDNVVPGEGTITVTMKGNYTGIYTKTFPIKANLANPLYIYTKAEPRRFTGSSIPVVPGALKVRLVDGSNVIKYLEADTDYTVTEVAPVGGNWATATQGRIKIEGHAGGYFTGTRNVLFEIRKNVAPGEDPVDPDWEDPDPDPEPVVKNLDVNDFSAALEGENNVKLTWSDNPNALGGYDITWTANGNSYGPYHFNAGRTSYTAKNLPNGTYTFEITATDGKNFGKPSTKIINIGGGPGPGPTPGGKEIFLQATANGTTVSLGWAGNNVVGADSYEITWTPATNGGRLRLNGGETHAINIENLSPNTTYTFNIQAMSGTTVIASGKQDVTTGSGGGTSPLSPVTGVQVKNNGGSSNTLSWTPRTNITGYNIYRSTSQGTRGSLIASMTSNYGAYTDTIGLQRGYRYYYTIVPFIRTSGVMQEGTPSSQVYVDVR